MAKQSVWMSQEGAPVQMPKKASAPQHTLTQAEADELMKKYARPKGYVDREEQMMRSDPIHMTWRVFNLVERITGSALASIEMICGYKMCKSLSPNSIAHGSAIVILLRDKKNARLLAAELTSMATHWYWTAQYMETEMMLILQPMPQQRVE